MKFQKDYNLKIISIIIAVSFLITSNVYPDSPFNKSCLRKQMDFNKPNEFTRYSYIYQMIKLLEFEFKKEGDNKKRGFFKIIRRSLESLPSPLRMIMKVSLFLFLISHEPMRSVTNITSDISARGTQTSEKTFFNLDFPPENFQQLNPTKQNDKNELAQKSKGLEKSSLPLFIFYVHHAYSFHFYEIEPALDSLFKQIGEQYILQLDADSSRLPPRVTVFWENADDLIYEVPLRKFTSWNAQHKRFADPNAEVFYKNVYLEKILDFYRVQDVAIWYYLTSENGKEFYIQDRGLDPIDWEYRRFEYFWDAIRNFPRIQFNVRLDRQSYESFLLKLEYMTKEVEKELKALNKTWETAPDELIGMLQKKIWEQRALEYRFHTLRYDLKDLVFEIDKEFEKHPGARIIVIRGFGHKGPLNKILHSAKYRPKIYFSKESQERYEHDRREFEESQSGSSGFVNMLKGGVRDLYDEICYLWESDYWEYKAFAIFFVVVLPALLVITIIMALIDSYSFHRKLNKGDTTNKANAKPKNEKIRKMRMQFKKKIRQIGKTDTSEDLTDNPDKLDKLLEDHGKRESGKNL